MFWKPFHAFFMSCSWNLLAEQQQKRRRIVVDGNLFLEQPEKFEHATNENFRTVFNSQGLFFFSAGGCPTKKNNMRVLILAVLLLSVFLSLGSFFLVFLYSFVSHHL